MKLCLCALLLSVVGCAQVPEPCSPAGLVAAKRAAGCGVILAGECDKHPLSDCPALSAAQNAHAAATMVCGSR